MSDVPGRQQLSGYILRDYAHAITTLGNTRKTRGMSLRALAEHVGCSHGAICQNLLGTHAMDAGNLIAAFDALGFDLALIPREDARPDAPETGLSRRESAQQGPVRGGGSTDPAQKLSGGLRVTTYEEWRVTGRPGHNIPGLVPLPNAGDRYQWVWSTQRGHTDPEATARSFVETARAYTDWTDGPHLHKRTVTVTDWEDVEQ